MPRIDAFSFGGGVQSTAALVLAAQGRVDCDLFLFANVGDDSEWPGTLDYVRDVSVPFAAKHDLRLVEIKREGRTLLEELNRADSRSLPIPVRMVPSGAPGTRNCTATFKIKVVARYARQHGLRDAHPWVLGLGISTDEYHRMSDSRIRYLRHAYPLIDLGLSRQDCHQIIADAGLPTPPKSACWFCPMHNMEDWRRVKRQRRDLFDRAADLEDNLNVRRSVLGKDPVRMHRSLIPLRELGQGTQETMLDDDGACDSGYCFT